MIASTHVGEESPNISPDLVGKMAVGNTHHCRSNAAIGKVAQRQYYPPMRRRKVKSVWRFWF